jgi:cytochrome oxidase Cu insertion factor (SCO1/SenC/PrrC family)
MTRRWRGDLIAASLILLSLVATARAQMVLPPDLKRTRGTHVPDVTLIGEDSTSFALSTLAGKPVVVNPVFTTCQQTCPMITANLRTTLTGIGEPGVGYQVLTISFDPADGPTQLREYRKKLELPAGWKLAVATPENRKAFFDAIDFHYEALPDGGFVHANVVAILTPTLTVSSYFHGVTYDAGEMHLALERATRESGLVRHYRPYIGLAAVLAILAVAVALFATRKKPAAA